MPPSSRPFFQLKGWHTRQSMKKPTAGQEEYVELGGGSKAEVYQAESDSLLSRLTHSVKNGVGALVEYFR